MGIAGDMVQFFATLDVHEGADGKVAYPRSLAAFLKAHPQHKGYYTRPHELLAMARQLENSILCGGGSTKGAPPLNLCFYSLKHTEAQLRYGQFEFLALGFRHIREHFAGAVHSIIATMKSGDPSIGTAFSLEDGRVLTARHCIEEPESIELPGWEPTKAPLTSVHVAADSKVDLAILTFDKNPFPGANGFRMRGGVSILEEVMAMGYPPIARFKKFLSTTTGQVAAEEVPYGEKAVHILTTARTRGGSSGGPLVNRCGLVVGLITGTPLEMAASSEHGARPNDMGYSCALHAGEVEAVYMDVVSDSAKLSAKCEFEVHRKEPRLRVRIPR